MTDGAGGSSLTSAVSISKWKNSHSLAKNALRLERSVR